MSDARGARDGSHDFDFQTGRWRIRNERLVKRLQGCTEWETFEAMQDARLLPGGLGNIDDFVTDHWPGFVGKSVRLYNPRTRQRSIYWATNRSGTLGPPVVGSFSDGVGEQAFSADDGHTWERNWIMTMTRIDEAAR
jgi:hypothetical protein